MKLSLGTVQFGINYGISNNNDITPIDEVKNIFDLAYDNDIHLIDTAPGYGESERVIGKAIIDKPFNIVTKTPVFKKDVIDSADIERVSATLDASLKKLQKRKTYGILIHNVSNLFAKNGNLIYEKLLKLKKEGLVEKIGVSVYDVKEADYILSNYEFDIIQLPINVFDQRFISSGMLKRLKDNNMEIHARSIFLQGLLLMPRNDLPSYFKKQHFFIMSYQNTVKEKGYSLLEAALSFVKQIPEIDRIIVGVNNSEQLKEIIDAYKQNVIIDFRKYSCNKKELIDPRIWEI